MFLSFMSYVAAETHLATCSMSAEVASTIKKNVHPNSLSGFLTKRKTGIFFSHTPQKRLGQIRRGFFTVHHHVRCNQSRIVFFVYFLSLLCNPILKLWATDI